MLLQKHVIKYIFTSISLHFQSKAAYKKHLLFWRCFRQKLLAYVDHEMSQLATLGCVLANTTLLCDLEISENECWQTLNKMSKIKVPGPDGFPAEFYMTFWGELKSLFLSCITYSIHMGEISPTQSQGIITLIPKKGKNPLSPSSYRPITLLNCGYKLISKLVNNRIKRFLKTLTNSDQSGFVKGRYIGDNIRLLFDIIDYTEFKQLPGAILFVDFFKAFDSF